jgi:hypothetical protein
MSYLYAELVLRPLEMTKDLTFVIRYAVRLESHKWYAEMCKLADVVRGPLAISMI